MDLQKMLSNIDPKQLQNAMGQLGLSKEQISQVNNMVNSGDGGKGLGNINPNDINAFLKSNPDLARQVKQADMLNKIGDIFRK
jgi:hypothetical protein